MANIIKAVLNTKSGLFHLCAVNENTGAVVTDYGGLNGSARDASFQVFDNEGFNTKGALNISRLAAYRAALIDPGCLEPLQVGLFSYPIGANETKIIRAARHTRLGSAGKWAVRDMRGIRPIRDATLTGIVNDAMAVITNTGLATRDEDPTKTYEDRMVQVFEAPTKTIGLAINQSSKLLLGAYGAIVTSVSVEDLIWLGVDIPSTGNALGYTLQEEIRDTESAAVNTSLSVRFSNALPSSPFPMHKHTANRIKAGTAELSGGAGGCCFTWMLCNKAWSKVPDPFGTPIFEDDFMDGTVLDPVKWVVVETTPGNLGIDQTHRWGKVFGTLVNPWANGCYSRQAFGRDRLNNFYCDIHCETAFAAGSFGGSFGFFNGTGIALADTKHTIATTISGGTGLRIYEDGVSVSPNGPGLTLGGTTALLVFAAKETLRLWIQTQLDGSAIYRVQGGAGNPVIGANTWTLLHTGTPVTNPTNPVRCGMNSQDSTAGNGHWSHPRVY